MVSFFEPPIADYGAVLCPFGAGVGLNRLINLLLCASKRANWLGHLSPFRMPEAEVLSVEIVHCHAVDDSRVCGCPVPLLNREILLGFSCVLFLF